MEETPIVKGRVSVLVPCYNGEKYIKRCINSILEQTWNDIELILVDDGSTDSSTHIIEEYRPKIEKKMSRFIYIKQDNMGVGAAMNTALKYFTGEFLSPFDCDDYMMPESLEVRATWLITHPETAVLQSNGYYVSEGNLAACDYKFCESTVAQENIPLFDLIIERKTYNWSGSYMIRSSSWLERCADREIYPSRSGQNLQLLLPAAYNNKCDYIPDCLMRYVSHIGSSSNGDGKPETWIIDALFGYEDIYKAVLKTFLQGKDYEFIVKKVEASFIKTIMQVKLSHGNKSGAKEYYQKLKDTKYCNLDDKIRYYKVMNSVAYYFFRLLRKILSILR